jgi:glutathionylspermidine synthase
VKLPWAAGERLRPDIWKSVRMQLMFDCCKWDIQSEDHSVVADYPLFVEEDEWDSVTRFAEKLSQEVLAAEQELLSRPDLHAKLSLPASIQKILRKCSPKAYPHGCARIMRFDFHFTPDGWRISEVNADVPGGFIEASGFTELMAEHYKSYLVPPDPTKAYVAAIRAVAGEGASIGLVHATAHCDDRQVMQYLGQRLERSGMQAVALSPIHLKWESGWARFTGPFSARQPALLVRFFPAEWLPNLHPSSWRPWFRGGTIPMSNPGTAILIQSKCLPLVWDELKTSLNTWRSLLPETKSANNVSPNSPEWVFKPVFGRVGEDVAITGVTEQRAYEEIIRDVSRHPHNWIAQRRFDTVPLETGSGVQYACLGVFTLDCRAVGAYGRIATKPLIDHDAQDIAVLIHRKDRENDGKRTV